MPSSINQVPGAEIEETLLLLRLMQMGCSPKADIRRVDSSSDAPLTGRQCMHGSG